MSCLCLGPKRAGKTHLLKALQDPDTVDFTTYSPPTIGTNIFEIKFPTKSSDDDDAKPAPSMAKATAMGSTRSAKQKHLRKSITVLEIGGEMAPLWNRYFTNVDKIIYVVDTSNLCRISASGVLLYSILSEPRLQHTKFLLVLTKMDYAYRQMRNEALLILQLSKLQKQIPQQITIVETSAVKKLDFDPIYDWLQQP